MKRTKQGQVTVEAAVLLTFIVAAFVFMGVYLQRGAQGGMKGNADSMGTQFQSTTRWSTTSNSMTHSNKIKTTTAQCANTTFEYGTPGTTIDVPTGPGAYKEAGDCTPEALSLFNSSITLP